MHDHQHLTVIPSTGTDSVLVALWKYDINDHTWYIVKCSWTVKTILYKYTIFQGLKNQSKFWRTKTKKKTKNIISSNINFVQLRCVTQTSMLHDLWLTKNTTTHEKRPVTRGATNESLLEYFTLSCIQLVNMKLFEFMLLFIHYIGIDQTVWLLGWLVSWTTKNCWSCIRIYLLGLFYYFCLFSS